MQPASSPDLYRPNGNGDYYGVKDYSGASASQIKQTFQTILNFAPVESLDKLLQATDPDHEIFRQQLREIVVARYLAQDNFAAVARVTQNPDKQQEYAQKAALASARSSSKWTPARNAAAPNVPKTKLSSGAMALAGYWASHRFGLTWIPLQAQVDPTDFKPADSDELRREENGIILKYPAQEVQEALDSLDELSHAIALWRKADELDPRGTSAPAALWKIIEARRSIAEESPYALQRAIDTNMAKSVRSDYDQLVQAFPASVEASRYAAYWTFPRPTDLDAAFSRSDLSTRYPNYDSVLTHYGHPAWFLALRIPFEDDESVQQDQWRVVCDQVYNLPQSSAATSQTEFAKSVGDLRRTAGPLALTLDRALLVNCLDDFVDLATVPNLDPAVRTEYVKARINLMITKASEPWVQQWNLRNKTPYPLAMDPGKNPQLQPITDFVDGLTMASAADDYAQLSSLAGAFLKKYPASPKRELAAFYQIRGALGVFIAGPDDVKSQALDAAFASYAKEFPSRKLGRGVRWMHGLAAMKRKKWGDAAVDFAFLLDQTESPELKQDSAYQLATLFDSLNDTSLRHDILTAIQSTPEVRAKLQQYVTCGEMPFLKDFILGALH